MNTSGHLPATEVKYKPEAKGSTLLRRLTTALRDVCTPGADFSRLVYITLLT